MSHVRSDAHFDVHRIHPKRQNLIPVRTENHHGPPLSHPHPSDIDNGSGMITSGEIVILSEKTLYSGAPL